MNEKFAHNYQEIIYEYDGVQMYSDTFAEHEMHAEMHRNVL